MKKNKIAFISVLMYALITSGTWAIISSYTNSYNRMNAEKIKSAALTLKGNTADLKVLKKTISFDIRKIKSESKIYYSLYILSNEELKVSGKIFFSMIN